MVITVTHTDQSTKMLFSDSGDLKRHKFTKNLHFKNLTRKQYFLYHIWFRENKKQTNNPNIIITTNHINTETRKIYFVCVNLYERYLIKCDREV